MAKIVVADALHKAVDTALQLLGARGYSKDTPLEWIYRYARQARLVDGASEVRKMVLARHLIDEGDDFWKWDVEDEHGRVPSVGEPAGEWWFDVRTGVVDEGHRAPGRDLLGPYPTRAEAEQALDLARRRTEAWEAEERAED